jgi:hypothetical protein
LENLPEDWMVNSGCVLRGGRKATHPIYRGEIDENIIDISPDFCHGFSCSLGPELDDGKLR